MRTGITKEAIQLRAIAWREYGKDFYDLLSEDQDRVYEEAQKLAIDDLFSQADAMIDREKYK